MIKSFRDLEVWRKSHELAKELFKLTDGFPPRYLFDLTAQLRRAALSIPTNLAEGCAAGSSKELLQFLNIAKRSVSEVQYLLYFAAGQDLVETEVIQQFDNRYEEVNRMLGGLRRSLHSKQHLSSNSRHSTPATRH